MAISVTDLRKIVDAPVEAVDSIMQIFVDSANLIATEDLSGAGFSSARLDKISLFLAAHYFTVSKEHGGLTRYKVGNSDEAYRQVSSTFVGFESTSYGQQAMALDTSGILRGLSSQGLKAQFRVLRPVCLPTRCEDDRCA